MITERIDIWKNDEYNYRAAYGFVPNIRTYLHEPSGEKRKAMLVVPGGGYCVLTPPESENIAKRFYEAGFNTFVLAYTTDITMSVPLKDQPLRDIARAVRLIRSRSDEFSIFEDKLTVCGFSAGGHLCGCLAVHHDDVKDADPALSKISARPDAVILAYPVITTGEYTHEWSVQALVGKDASGKDREYFSVEKFVTEDTPPCFIWQTAEDGLVPVENSYLMAMALRKKGVKFAHYVFPRGDHGLSLPGEDFFMGRFGGEFVFEQVNRAIENVRNNTAVDVSEERRAELIKQFDNPPVYDNGPTIPEYKDIEMWPSLALTFLEDILG